MKNFFAFCFLLTSVLSFAQSSFSNDTTILETPAALNLILENTNQLVKQNELLNESRGRYKMYKTENIYNLLKLDTATGRIEQVQWSLDDNEEFTVWINSSNLSYSGKIGAFELYPTKNMYQFILLDTTDGRTWHVQWGTEANKRWIRRIY